MMEPPIDATGPLRPAPGLLPSGPRRLRQAETRVPVRWLVMAACAVALSGCGRRSDPANASAAPDPAAVVAASPVGPPGVARQLAVARVDAAKACLREHAPDRALALLVAASAADPGFLEGSQLVRQILAETQWQVPVLELKHELPVTQVVFAPPSSLWVGLTEPLPDGFGTVVRWDTAGLKIESVLFPGEGMPTRELVPGSKDHTLVIQRGSGARTVELLCQAQSLRPICALERLPVGLTGQALTQSSENGLLVARPGEGEGEGGCGWQIRDAATGEIIRSSGPPGENDPQPVAAHLDARRLRVLRVDGSLWDLPVSPVEPPVTYPAATPLTILQARFSEDGAKVLVLLGQGPGCAPVRQQGAFQVTETGGELVTAGESARSPAATWVADSTAPDLAWWEGVPWTTGPSWWDHLLRDHGNRDDQPAVRVSGQEVAFLRARRAPVWASEPLTAVTLGHDTVATGTASGVVRVHQFLPLPRAIESLAPDQPLGTTALATLSAALSGLRYDETSREFIRLSDAQRRSFLDRLDPEDDSAQVAGLDLSPTLAVARQSRLTTAPTAALLPLWDRLTRADRSGKSWPRWLALGQALGDSRWHQDLSEAVARRKAVGSAAARDGDGSPWLAQERVREVFQKRDEAALKAELQASGGHGPAAATALALALGGDSPEWLEWCWKAATDLPPLLRVLAESRVAWRQNRLADAISMWPDEFPNFETTRLQEDWDGWEQADFASCYEAHLKDLKAELATYELSPQATPVERAALAARLLDPATRGIIGRRRLADNCLKAALAMADFQGESTVTFELASRARALGAAAEPCLRAEAAALTRMKDFARAHPRWVALLTEHPVATHRANDYAEAAYTAFENGDPNQAVEILGTGITRFPDDSGYALRAGWIALLTANYNRGYQFLLAGLRIGYPDDKKENACLLLTVAASLAGFPEDAATHYFNLVEMAPAWEKSETVDALQWPAELKAPLTELMPLPEVLPEVLPASNP